MTGGTLDDAEVREADSTAKAQAVIPDEEVVVVLGVGFMLAWSWQWVVNR